MGRIKATSGHKARMTKLFTGRSATRPIPLPEYESDRRASMAAAADQRPKGKATRMPSGPRVGGVSEVFGTPVSKSPRGGVFNPTSGLEKTV
jgi:hypothetical protein